jgi:hypothetical protein
LTSLTGIEPQHVENADDLATVMGRLKAKIPTDAIIVGQGIASDIKWLRLEEGVDFKEQFDVALLFRTPVAHSHRDPTAGAWTPPPSPQQAIANAAAAQHADGEANGSSEGGVAAEEEAPEGGTEGGTEVGAAAEAVNTQEGGKEGVEGAGDALGKEAESGKEKEAGSDTAAEGEGVNGGVRNGHSPKAQQAALSPTSTGNSQGKGGKGGKGPDEMVYRYYSLRHAVRWLLGTDMQVQ